MVCKHRIQKINGLIYSYSNRILYILGTSSTNDFVSSNALVHEGDEQPLCVSHDQHTELNGDHQSIADSDAVHQSQLPTANRSVTPVSSYDELVDKTLGPINFTSSQDESITAGSYYIHIP